MKMFSGGRSVRYTMAVAMGLLVCALLPCQELRAEEAPFYPTWKLLSRQEKQQFVSGYLQGWRDARSVLSIAAGYLRENPGNAAQSLTQLERVYDLGGLSPEIAVREIDRFFEEPDNHTAGLSQAVAALRAAR